MLLDGSPSQVWSACLWFRVSPHRKIESVQVASALITQSGSLFLSPGPMIVLRIFSYLDSNQRLEAEQQISAQRSYVLIDDLRYK